MRRILPTALAAALLVASGAEATVIKRIRLEQAVRDADEIFIGTVKGLEAVDGGPPRNLIFTDVTFEQLEVVKGKIAGRSVTYRFAGGVLGDRRVRVFGMPEFEVGVRHVLFASARRDWACPAVGWHQGRYNVTRDERAGKDFVADSEGRPVYGFEEGQPLLAPAKKGDAPLTLSAFLELVRDILREQSPDNRPAEEDPPPPEEQKEEPGGGE